MNKLTINELIDYCWELDDLYSISNEEILNVNTETFIKDSISNFITIFQYELNPGESVYVPFKYKSIKLKIYT